MTNKILSVEHNKEINLANGEIENNVYIRVYTSLFASGLVAKMGANRFTTLMALASYMDAEGVCSPTQIQLADSIGVHKNTINKYINELLDFEVEGTPLVTRTKVNKGQGNILSFYKIHPLSQLATIGDKVTPEAQGQSLIIKKGNTQPDPVTIQTISNSSDAIKFFQQIYRDVYNVNYTVGNYGREGKLIKDKVLTPYPDLAKDIIELAVRKYDELFKNPRYPRPSIAMFSWAVNQIIPLIEEERKLSEIASKASELEAQAEQRLAGKMAKLIGGAV